MYCGLCDAMWYMCMYIQFVFHTYIYTYTHIYRHHCRLCGKIYCDECSRKRYNVPRFDMKSVRVCNTCYGVLKALNVEDVRQTK